MNDVPSWLAPSPTPTQSNYFDLPVVAAKLTLTQQRRAIERHTFAAIYDGALEHLASGEHLRTFCEDDPRKPDHKRFIAWIHEDDKRRVEYQKAQEIGAEVVFSQIIEIADAENSLEDTDRSTLRINARKWVLGVANRRRFGDVKQIEMGGSISILGALEQAKSRVIEMAEVVEDAPVIENRPPAEDPEEQD